MCHVIPAVRFFRRNASLARLVALASLAGLSGCATTGLSDMTASVASSTTGLFQSAPKGQPMEIAMFVASTRRDGGNAIGDGTAKYSLAFVSVPPGHKAGVIEAPAFGSASRGKHFVMGDVSPLRGQEFRQQISSHISGRVGSNRDVLVYVHGFNNTLKEARFRLAQIVADGQFGGVPVLFTWPATESVWSYGSARESAAVSRDALGKMLGEIAETPGIGKIHVLAHSMGTWLAMEALRERTIAGDRNLGGKLGDVMLAAPDIDLNVFKQQVARLGDAHISVFVSPSDRALTLSGRLAGDRPRVGAMDPNDPRDRGELAKLGVKVYDLSLESSGFIGHGTYANAPAVVRTIGAQLAEPRKEDAATTAIIGERPVIDPPPSTAVVTSDLPPASAPASPAPVAASAN